MPVCSNCLPVAFNTPLHNSHCLHSSAQLTRASPMSIQLTVMTAGMVTAHPSPPQLPPTSLNLLLQLAALFVCHHRRPTAAHENVHTAVTALQHPHVKAGSPQQAAQGTFPPSSQPPRLESIRVHYAGARRPVASTPQRLGDARGVPIIDAAQADLQFPGLHAGLRGGLPGK